MFEQELEMEEREASAVPLLLIVALILVIVGVSGYYLWQYRQVLTPQEAASVIDAVEAQMPATIQVHVGKVTASVNVKPHDPNYRLLEKAGFLKLGKDQGPVTLVTLTSEGETQLQKIAGVTKTKEEGRYGDLRGADRRPQAGGDLQGHHDQSEPCDRRLHLEMGAESVRRGL